MSVSKMQQRRLALGAAAGLAVLFGAQASQAGAIAYSTLEVDSFQFFRGDGSQYAAGDFDSLEVSNFSKGEAELNGSGVVGTNANDVALQCVGNCAGIGQNDFSRQPGIGYFSRGDAVLSGAGVGGLGGQDFVNTNTVAEVQLDDDGIGTSGANTGTGSRFSFNVANDDVLDIRFDATPFLQAMLGEPDVMSFAGVAWSLNIRDSSGAAVFSWTPDGLAGGIVGGTELLDPFSLNTSLSILSTGDVAYDPGTGSFRAITGVLTAGESYTLSINHETSANAELEEAAVVMEPASLGMFGLGLLGLAAAARRRRSG